jgi:sulfite reductase subunit B
MPDVETSRSDLLTMVFYRPQLARILSVSKLTEAEALFDVEMEGGNPIRHGPGQFVQVSVFGHGEAPISICSSPTRAGGFELCVRAVGNVSRGMHELAAGDWVGIRGPYGHGFPVVEMKNRDLLMIAGGIGVAPLRSLVNYVRDKREEYGRLIVVYGARDPSAILFRDEVQGWLDDPEIEMYLTVDKADDTWKGRTGVITAPLREIDLDPADNIIAAVVGPPVMYRFVAMELFKKGLDSRNIFFSLERRFKCGIGKCGHCQLNDLYVCQDGPVFRYSHLLGRSEAIEVWAPERDQD